MLDHHLVLPDPHPPAHFVEHLHRISAATNLGWEKQSLRTFSRRWQVGWPRTPCCRTAARQWWRASRGRRTRGSGRRARCAGSRTPASTWPPRTRPSASAPARWSPATKRTNPRKAASTATNGSGARRDQIKTSNEEWKSESARRALTS
jgi:hypothetical protein